MKNNESLIEYLLGNLDKTGKPLLVLIAYVLTGLLGTVDYLTGTAYSFGIFYVLPVSLIAYYVSRNAGLLISVVSALVWFFAETTASMFYADAFAPYWNALTRLVFFIVITVLIAALRAALEHQRSLAHTDFLTGAANARSFTEQADREINRSRRYGQSFSIAHIDVDNFKMVNDTRGHHAGDELLKIIVSTANKTLRNVDVVARLGGDEFALLLPETRQDAAQIVINKVVRTLRHEMQKNSWPVTFSVGLLTCMDTSYTVDELLKLADELTYAAKKSGKDRIMSDIVVSENAP